jgi:Flp pilus assembly protein TadB
VIGVGIAFIVVGLIFLFLIPWVGIAVGIIGLVLAVFWLAGFGRRAMGRDSRVERERV